MKKITNQNIILTNDVPDDTSQREIPLLKDVAALSMQICNTYFIINDTRIIISKVIPPEKERQITYKACAR